MKHSVKGCKCKGTSYTYNRNTMYPGDKNLQCMMVLATEAGCCVESCNESTTTHYDGFSMSRTYTHTRFVLHGSQEQIAEFLKQW